MTTLKSLPARPSLESLRKQARKLARDIAAGSAEALARVRVQWADAELPLSQRDAQLVLAREYGFAGWQALTAEVLQRQGKGLDWAAAQAHRAIHDNDIERLKQLLQEFPGLLSWRDEGGGLIASATNSYGDSFDPGRELHFTRRACAELLLDAGAVVDPSVWEDAIGSRARGTLQLLWSKGVLPRTLKILVALGDIDAVRAHFDGRENQAAEVEDAFLCACRFENEAIASFLLDQCIALDPDLGQRIDAWSERPAFIKYMVDHLRGLQDFLTPRGPRIGAWQAFVMHQVMGAINEDELENFSRWLQREPWLLGEPWVGFQEKLFGRAALNDRVAFIDHLFGLAPAILNRRPPPPTQAIEFAFEYGKTHLIPLLTRIWPLPDDLPSAAGLGDLARVKRWFDASGKPVLGNLADHFPGNCPPSRRNARGVTTEQRVLDTAFAWAVVNSHFEVAQFLLDHGADINTDWSTHEPASILHELVFRENYEAMQFLIDRGIDMTIVDYRWGGTAAGWAYHAANNEKMAKWLGDAEQRRKKNTQ